MHIQSTLNSKPLLPPGIHILKDKVSETSSRAVMLCNIKLTEGGLIGAHFVFTISNMMPCKCVWSLDFGRHSLARQTHTLLEQIEGSGELCIQALSVALYSVGHLCCSVLSHYINI